jgi:hypothetical protein
MSRAHVRSTVLLLAACVAALPARLPAQGGEPPRTIDFSGVLYANFNYRTDSATKAANGGKPGSRFDIDRVYLTFRMPAGDRASVRVTTDIFTGDQSSSSFYRGWTARLKYAYLQLNVSDNLAGVDGLAATARVGMLHTVAIEHEEGFWPRYLGTVGIDRNNFFSSSDVGAALQLTLPNRLGEVYGVITNGPGYTATENDRFKDFALRASLTPFASSDALNGIAKSIALTGWVYAGQTASRFRTGGEGQVGPVSDGLARNRLGVFAGVKDRRLTAGVSHARRTETTETGDNTVASPRRTADVSGSLTSLFALVRPGAWRDPASRAASWGLIGRLDTFTPDTDADPANRFTVLGAFWEPTSRVTFSLDHQAQARANGSTTPESSILFLRLQALF